MRMTVVNTLPRDVWSNYVREHPNGNIFHTPEMFEVFSLVKGNKPDIHAVIDSNNKPLALLLTVDITLFSRFLKVFTTRAVAYGSILISPDRQGEEALSLLLETYIGKTGRRVLFTELRNLSDLTPLQPCLNKYGFTYEEHLNYLINLNCSPEAMLQSFGKRTRANIRRALKKYPLLIENVDSFEKVSRCYSVMHQVYTTARIPIPDKSLFEALFKVLHPRGMVKFTLARVEDAYAATSVDLLYKDIIYGWYGGHNRAFNRYLPNEQVLWYLFKWGAENGYALFDFGGAGKPDEKYGVRDFKAKFGGEVVCFGRNTYVHSPTILSCSKLAYRLYRILLKVRGSDT